MSTGWPRSIAFIVLFVVAVGARPAHALSCVSGPPVCQASANDRVCSLQANRTCNVNADCAPTGGTCIVSAVGVAGTVAANPNPIASIVLTGATNLSIAASVPPTASSATFRVVQTNPGLDASGTVLATDSIGGTCQVPVSFHLRTAGAISPGSPETICPLSLGYSLTVESAPSSPAGTVVCASHQATCTDLNPALPGGYDYLDDSRVLSVRSPIAGLGVQMVLTRSGTYDSRLHILFSRSTDGGISFSSPWADVWTSTVPGSTIIRGTGQWSDIKVVAAVPPGIGPTIGQWGAVILILLLMASSSVLFAQRRGAYATMGGGRPAGPVPVDRRVLIRSAAVAGVGWIIAIAAATAWSGLPTTTDLVGSWVSAGILAYQIHLWVIQSRR